MDKAIKALELAQAYYEQKPTYANRCKLERAIRRVEKESNK